MGAGIFGPGLGTGQGGPCDLDLGVRGALHKALNHGAELPDLRLSRMKTGLQRLARQPCDRIARTDPISFVYKDLFHDPLDRRPDVGILLRQHAHRTGRPKLHPPECESYQERHRRQDDQAAPGRSVLRRTVGLLMGIATGAQPLVSVRLQAPTVGRGFRGIVVRGGRGGRTHEPANPPPELRAGEHAE